MNPENPGNGERGGRRILEDLKHVHQKLAELEAMQPLLRGDIAAVQAGIEHLEERLAAYDNLAEQRLESAELADQDALAIARAMSGMAGNLETFAQEKVELLDTRMVLETAIADLRERAQELLGRLPKGTQH